MKTKPYIIKVAYDGTDYHGWQEQKDLVTVAGTLQNTFFKTFNEKIKTVGASRTDAGVHARGQVARFYTALDLEPEKILKVWNDNLPKDIQIISLWSPEEGFHPQHNVERKVYHYYFSNDRPTPFNSRYVAHWFYEVDARKLEAALKIFVGTYDFKMFATETEGKETVCTIDQILFENASCLEAQKITVKGKRFLHNMVRRIVGAALKVASDKNFSVDDIKKALDGEILKKQLPTAPACGLFLDEIVYDF